MDFTLYFSAFLCFPCFAFVYLLLFNLFCPLSSKEEEERRDEVNDRVVRRGEGTWAVLCSVVVCCDDKWSTLKCWEWEGRTLIWDTGQPLSFKWPEMSEIPLSPSFHPKRYFCWLPEKKSSLTVRKSWRVCAIAMVSVEKTISLSPFHFIPCQPEWNDDCVLAFQQPFSWLPLLLQMTEIVFSGICVYCV